MRFGKETSAETLDALERRLETSEAALRAIVSILAELPATSRYVHGGYGGISSVAALQPYAPEPPLARFAREAREAGR